MDQQRTLILLDNGSSRPQSTLSLRRIAADLGSLIARPVHPLSLMHANKGPPGALDGPSADTLQPFLRTRARAGTYRFLILPVFFGPSRALSTFIPDTVKQIDADYGPLDLRIADVLCPLPGGEPRLTEILHDNLLRCAQETGISPKRVVLVDHGSPTPAVTTVRRSLAVNLQDRMGTGVHVEEAAMERRAGPKYDFSGDLLEDLLHRLAREDRYTPVLLSMLFLLPGRHAGPDGDVERICRSVEREWPPFRVHRSPLVGDHPLLIQILKSRVEAELDAGRAPPLRKP